MQDKLENTQSPPAVHAHLISDGYDEYYGEWGVCSNCGHSNIMGSNYCNYCGVRLEKIKS